MRIAVTTPNGHVGRHLTRTLVRAGVRPLLLTRHPGALDADLLGHVDVAEADSFDVAQVCAATAGVDAIYWVDPSVMSPDPLGDYARATEALCAAVCRNRIARVVFQSSVGAERRHGAGEIDGLAATEVALDGLSTEVAAGGFGVDVAHLRCGYFFTNLLLDLEALRGGLLQTVMLLGAPLAWVAPRDVAEVAAGLLLNRDWHGRRVQAVHGPADLTWAEVASVLTAETGRAVRVERVPDAVQLDRLRAAGMPPAMAEAVLGMLTGLRDGFTPEQARSVVSTTPTALPGWVRDELVPALGEDGAANLQA